MVVVRNTSGNKTPIPVLEGPTGEEKGYKFNLLRMENSR
jgi:hypothetical protein